MEGGRSRADSALGEVQVLIDRLSNSAKVKGLYSSTDQINKLSNGFRELRHLLVDLNPPRKAKDAFRRAGGFEIVFKVVEIFLESFTKHAIFDDIRTERIEIVKCALMTASEAIFDHVRNRQYCSDLGIWKMVEQGLGSILLAVSFRSNLKVLEAVYEQQQLFGLLFAVALCEDSVLSIFRLVQAEEITRNQSASSSCSTELSADDSPAVKLVSGSKARYYGHIFSATDLLWNAETVPIIVKMWLGVRQHVDKLQDSDCPEQPLHSESSAVPEQYLSLLKDLSNNVIFALTNLVRASTFNAVAVHNSNVSMTILKATFSSNLQSSDASNLTELALELLKLGMSNLEDTADFFRAAENTPSVCQTLLAGIKNSREAPQLLFDLSMHGFASLEFSQLSGPFPPNDQSQGYTLTAWIQVIEFDDSCHTTIFGAFDASQTCFVLLYLESETHQLVLQTSISSKTPSVRFKSITFQEKLWYHVAVVHHRRKSTAPSRVTLYINGEFSEQKRCPYPESPPVFRAEETHAEQRSQARYAPSPVQCFFGTPQDLSPRLGRNVLSSKWALAAAHLFYEILSDDLILVYCQMGPSYRGNFQDCLGSFQTYKASTILNLRNEERHGSDEHDSAITMAVRSKASQLNSEQNVSLSISAHAILSMDDPVRYESWSLKARATIENLFNAVSTKLLVNAAIPVVARAVARPNGIGSVMGGVVVYRPSAIEDSCWRMSGCVSTSLRLIAQASTLTALILALDISLELTRKNWRNSEAMERGGGFGALAWILRTKMFPDSATNFQIVQRIRFNTEEINNSTSLSKPLLQSILHFVGFNSSDPRKSTINNPLAYRQLVVDCGVWERADQVTQKLYFEQYVVFASQSHNRTFNARRLNRMRIVKKFIDAMKARSITEDVAPNMLEALRALLEGTVTAEILRSLALYITYALFAHNSPQARHGLKLSIEPDQNGSLSSMELGIKTLQMLSSFLCDTEDNARVHKFARTITSKWLLHLLAQVDARVVVPVVTILVRVLITGGPKYLLKFDEKNGFVILRRRLQRWWHVPEVWSSCWDLLFGHAHSQFGIHDTTGALTLAQILSSHDAVQFFCPSIIRVMLAMAESCLKDSLLQTRHAGEEAGENQSELRELQRIQQKDSPSDGSESVVKSAVETLIALHSFRAFQVLATSRHFTRDLLAVLYGVVKEDVEARSDEREFRQRDGDENAYITNDLESVANVLSSLATVSSNSTIHESPSAEQAPLRIRRNSSFVMVSSKQSGTDTTPKFAKQLGPRVEFSDDVAFKHPMFQQLARLLVVILIDQVIGQQDFSGLGLFLKAPSVTTEQRSSINSLVLQEVVGEMTREIASNPRLLHEPKTLANLVRFTQQTYEAILEGWLLHGSLPLFNFMMTILGYLKRPDICVLKSIRLCSPSISLLQGLLWRLSLYQLVVENDVPSEDDHTSSNSTSEAKIAPNYLSAEDTTREYILVELLRRSDILFGPLNSEDPSTSSPNSDPILLPALCFILCQKIMNGNEPVRTAALNLYRIVISHSPRQLMNVVKDAKTEEMWLGLSKTVTSHPGSISAWLFSNREKLDKFLNDTLKTSLVQFIHRENMLSLNTGSSRVSKRSERLHQWQLDELAEHHAWTEHDLATVPWANNICESEVFKHFRARQDLQDAQEYFEALFRKYDVAYNRQKGPTPKERAVKWSLDETEGRSRMRMRLLPAEDAQDLDYKPKRRHTIAYEAISRAGDSRERPKSTSSTPEPRSRRIKPHEVLPADSGTATPEKLTRTSDPSPAEDFEIVQEVEDDLEDKNRKVMRSLQRGEQVHTVYNVSRIRGLEAYESLLIVGEKSLYLLSHLFQRSDGEIVHEWQAPADERDPYTHMITGREIKRPKHTGVHEVGTGTRHWTWSQIISVSKRRFLSRPVGLEMFFQDGRSYLLTAMSEQERNRLYTNLVERAVKLRTSSASEEDAWRVELLPDPKEPPQTVGSRLASVFTLRSLLPATTRWVSGDISNFQYLMMINTVAGRTFNDLTQYPVFPWVIADYSSEVLDLDNPRTFRDFTKPMGCQNPSRETSFRERFQAFAEMSEQRTPAFHYGTHYSTAMIVTSFLIRLQPFVDAYLLLQGGTFDHADRLFYSIEKAWLSASRETMSDVRELTPEFFYLPDFLTNLNNYDFGSREANGERINHVILPPWAKGDPELFIAKNREALESPYVSQNLHSWIDLIFGSKQRGEAAIEAANVFHHLSYQDATDLDTIGDGMERLATIGIIHNFGQTPAQVFKRPHERRETAGAKTKRLHRLIDSLHRLPAPIYKHHSQICQLDYAVKQQRLLCCGPFRSFMPSKHNIVVEWGHVDNSIRFYNSDSKKLLGIFEQPHQDDITSAIFVDSTLVTASRDCTVAVWNVSISPDAVDLQVQGALFGHREPVAILRVSRSLSTILSVDISGRVLLWDLNGLDLVREIPNTRPVQYAQINSLTGHIVLCCEQRVVIYSLNGRLLLDQPICAHSTDRIHCCSFYESSSSAWIDTELLFTGQRWGVVNVWKLAAAGDGTWQLMLVRRMDHIDRSRTDGRNMPCAITAICPLDHNLYTGDEEGNVFEWACSR